MSIHVGEIHTEVTTTAAPAAAGGGAAGERTAAPPGEVVDRWRQTRAEASRLACRVAAEGFDD